MNTVSLIIFIGVVFLVALILKFLKPNIGKHGEVKVFKILRRLNSEKYRVINDVLITNQGRSSQIDHIVISPYGIFVIETKNYKGWIFGHESSVEWTQTLYRKKYKFRNPILQNWGHIRTLKTVLSEFPLVKYFPIIVFAGTAKLKNITSTIPVITSNELLRYISNNSTYEYISDEEVDQIHQQIVRLNRTERVYRKSHVRKAKTRSRSGVEPPTCPRCGGRLLLKDGKYGWFYGCSHFPNCNYSKDYNK